jgi:glycosyltransferase involved in cell wall biosynthesis
MPAISVIVPAYNAGDCVLRTVKSVLDGRFSDLEVIIVDDGSTDNTPAQARLLTDPSSAHYDDRVRYVYQENTGKAGAVNRAFSMMKGDFVTIVDADDVLPPRSLESRFHPLKNARDAVASVGSMLIHDETENVRGTRPVPDRLDPAYLYKSFFYRYKSPFSLNQLLVPRTVIKKVGDFNEALQRCQDIEYFLRLMQQLDGIVPVPEPVYTYRKYRSSPKKRIRIRLKTVRDRARAYASAYDAPVRYLAIVCGIVLDLGKLAYELQGNYGK